MSTRGRIIFDLLLTVLLLFECFHQLTGNVAHEIVGVAFFACIVIHLVFASSWIRKAGSAFKNGEMGKKQKRLALVAILMLIDLLVLMCSSVTISQLLWDAGIDLTWLNPNQIWYPVHTVSAYVLCILVLGHLSMHWKTVADTLNVPYDPSRREAITSGINAVVMIGGIALGITGATRAGFQASDFSVNDEEDSKTVESGYREVNAQTGEYTDNHSFEAASISESTEASEEESAADEDVARCPLCPRQCKLSAPRCGRPYEAGLI